MDENIVSNVVCTQALNGELLEYGPLVCEHPLRWLKLADTRVLQVAVIIVNCNKRFGTAVEKCYKKGAIVLFFSVIIIMLLMQIAFANNWSVTNSWYFVYFLSSLPTDELFVIIHNIDGAMLRGSKVQSVLSHLAQIPAVHIVASIDHINAPLSKCFICFSK